MTRLEVKSRIGPDGVLDVKIPIGREEANREVLVTVEATNHPAANIDDWRRFIRQTAGSIDDPTFRRHEQGNIDQRENLE